MKCLMNVHLLSPCNIKNVLKFFQSCFLDLEQITSSQFLKVVHKVNLIRLFSLHTAFQIK